MECMFHGRLPTHPFRGRQLEYGIELRVWYAVRNAKVHPTYYRLHTAYWVQGRVSSIEYYTESTLCVSSAWLKGFLKEEQLWFSLPRRYTAFPTIPICTPLTNCSVDQINFSFNYLFALCYQLFDTLFSALFSVSMTIGNYLVVLL